MGHDLADALAPGGAIDFTIDEACFLGGQKYVDRCQFNRLTRPTEIAVLTKMHHLLIGLSTRRLQHRPDGTWCDGIHTHAFF